MSARTPVSTYRMQFNRGFTFEQAAPLIDYLYELGITDCYASPLALARPGSAHGYDVTNHGVLNPEIGSEEQLFDFARQLQSRGMGLILDTVPNHMYIAHPSNQWWWDILENGPSSPYARFSISTGIRLRPISQIRCCCRCLVTNSAGRSRTAR